MIRLHVNLVKLMTVLLFLVCIYHTIPFVNADITFLATRNVGLGPREYTDGSTSTVVDNILNVVADKRAYDEVFEPTPINSQTEQNPNPTEPRPNIELVRGNDFSVEAPTEIRTSPHGFVGTVLEAYAKHQNLRLRPDDIWIAILSQFSMYFQPRAEQLRDLIVDFEGQEVLTVEVAGSMRTFQSWEIFPPTFLELMSEKVKDPSITEWFIPDFTTTTENDKVAAAASAMCAFQAFFKYVIVFICGIPQVTLMGTVDDWQNLLDRSARLADFDDGTGVITNEWLPMLQGVLMEFVESARNGSESNLDFWDQIAYSASIPYGGSFLGGWINTFSFFDRDGDVVVKGVDPDNGRPWGSLKPDDINENVLSCPISIIDADREEYNSTLFVGQMAYERTPDGEASVSNPALDPDLVDDVMLVSPRVDWAIVVHTQDMEEKQRMTDSAYEGGRPRSSTCSDARFNPLCQEHDDTSFCEYFTGSPSTTPSAVPSTTQEPSGSPSLSLVPSVSSQPSSEPTRQTWGCFSAESTVMEEVKGMITMDELKIGDRILSDANKYSRVYGFGHRHESVDATFLRIVLENSNDNRKGKTNWLEITSDHLLMVNGSMMPASVVEVGDTLQNGTTNSTLVVAGVEQIQRKGVYGPFTEDGTIVVNGVIVSNYVTVQSDRGKVDVFGIQTGLGVHELAHAFEGIHRTVCVLWWSVCEKEQYTANGISWWLLVPFELMKGVIAVTSDGPGAAVDILTFLIAFLFTTMVCIVPGISTVKMMMTKKTV